MAVAGGVLSIIAVLIFFWKRKRLKQMLLFMLVINGLSVMKSMESYAISQNVLKPTEIKYLLKGTVINEQPSVIDGYTYVGYLHTGRNKANPQPTQIAEGQVEIRYKSAKGKTLADPIVLKGKVGESYQAGTKEIDGYVQKEVQGPAVGVFLLKNKLLCLFMRKWLHLLRFIMWMNKAKKLLIKKY